MQQHPVPQHISSYEFKLVGDMTLKQFFQLAGGLAISLVFYATPLPGVIKWPLAVLFGLSGAALAFLPIEERPLSQWVFAFIKAIYSPTIYTYDENTTENIFGKQSFVQESSLQEKSNLEVSAEVQKFEQLEKNFISRLMVMFSNTPLTQPPLQRFPQNLPNQPLNISPIQDPGRIITEELDNLPKPVTPPLVQNLEARAGMPVPQSMPIKVTPFPYTEASPKINSREAPGVLTPIFNEQNNSSSARQAVFTPEAAPPAPPERPNTIVGQVITKEGKIIEGAIMEIRDANTKTPVRALRSNRVGHFITVTPVQDGVYEIITEKENFAFDPIQFKAEGRLIPPIQIKAK